MNDSLKRLKSYVTELLNNINCGNIDLTNSEIDSICDTINICNSHKKYYYCEAIDYLNLEFGAEIPNSRIDKDGIKFWYKNDLNRLFENKLS